MTCECWKFIGSTLELINNIYNSRRWSFLLYSLQLRISRVLSQLVTSFCFKDTGRRDERFIGVIVMIAAVILLSEHGPCAMNICTHAWRILGDQVHFIHSIAIVRLIRELMNIACSKHLIKLNGFLIERKSRSGRSDDY